MGWLSGWRYRKSHQIVGSTSGAVTDYQICITVHYGSGTDSGKHVYLNGKCRTDFGDVRFTASDGSTELSYWIESKTDGDVAIFWVKVPSIPASPNAATIYIYYGNPSATTTSNGDNTFIFFDNFPGTSLNTSKWIINAVNTITYTVNNYFRFTDATKSGSTYWIYDGTSTGSQHHAKVTLPANFRVLFTTQVSDSSTSQMGQGGIAIIANDNTIIVYPYHGDWYSTYLRPERWVTTENTVSNVGSGWTATTTGSGPTNNSVYKTVSSGDRAKWDMRKYGSTVSVYDENGLECSVTILSSPYKIALAAGAYGTNPYLDYVQVDYVAVANYIDPEPSHGAWGTEETPYYLEATVSVSAQLIRGKLEAIRQLEAATTVTPSISTAFVKIAHLSISVPVTAELKRKIAAIRNLSISVPVTAELRRVLSAAKSLSASLSASAQLAVLKLIHAPIRVTVPVSAQLMSKIATLRQLTKTVKVTPSLVVKSKEEYCGLPDYITSFNLHMQTLSHLRIDIAACSLGKIDINIASATTTLDVKVTNATLNVNITNSRLDVNVTNAQINIYGQGGSLDTLGLSDSLIKAYSLRSTYGYVWNGTNTFLTIPSGYTAYILSVSHISVNRSTEYFGTSELRIYDPSIGSVQKLSFHWVAIQETRHSDIPLAIPAKLKSGGYFQLWADAQTETHAIVRYILVPSSLVWHFERQLFNRLGIREIEEYREENTDQNSLLP